MVRTHGASGAAGPGQARQARQVRRRTLAGVLLGAGWLFLRLALRAQDEAAVLLAAHRDGTLDASDLQVVVATLLLVVGAAVACWYAATALVALAVRGLPVAGPRRRVEAALRRWGAPVLRRALAATALTGLGVTLTVTSSGAVVEPDRSPLPADLGWASTVSQPVAPHTASAPATPPPVTSEGPPAVSGRVATGTEVHTVEAGDSLWSIAASRLPPDAAAADVAAAWPRWYETNRDVLGADPDLIHPGQHLLAPIEETS